MSTTAITNLDHHPEAQVSVYWNNDDFIRLSLNTPLQSLAIRLSKRDAVALCMDLHRAAEATA